MKHIFVTILKALLSVHFILIWMRLALPDYLDMNSLGPEVYISAVCELKEVLFWTL